MPVKVAGLSLVGQVSYHTSDKEIKNLTAVKTSECVARLTRVEAPRAARVVFPPRFKKTGLPHSREFHVRKFL